MERSRVVVTSRYGGQLECTFDGYRQEPERLGPDGAPEKVVQWRGTGVLVDNGRRFPFLFTTEPEHDHRFYALRAAVIAIRDDRGNRRNPMFVFNWLSIETDVVETIRWMLRSRMEEVLPTIRIPSLSATALMMRGLISTIDRIT
ncbi:MAG: hypothetical protein IT405_02030 [Candidatus Yanofskybacteria bacterium]|nr:hypothetical protein [Candidatus Yanofskybacteria bacterium]